MATSLQQQLAAIAANSTHQLDLKAQKSRHSKSLLFEPRDAASQSFETIYQICYEGFEELCMLDARLTGFSRNLFSEQSKNEDRTQMTAKENEELDRTIESFLGLVGGRLLLKPAIKAVEWLVRRFRVEEYSTEAVLLTFLPYHTSHIFPTLLSILPEQLPPTFRWLHPYVASLQSPPRHAVLSAAINNPGFFSAFSQYVLRVAKARHHSAVLLGFWASITAQSVNGMIDSTRSGRDAVRKQREEDVLLRILPILQSALTVRGVPELFLGSCMIMTILATKATLGDGVLDAMMDAIAGAWTEQSFEDGLTCLAVLAEEKTRVSLPRSVRRAVFKDGEAVSILNRLADNHRTDKLMLGLLFGSLDGSTAHPSVISSTFMDCLLADGRLSDEHNRFLVESLLSMAGAKAGSLSVDEPIVLALRSISERPATAAHLKTIASRTGIDLRNLIPDLTLDAVEQGTYEIETRDIDRMEIDERSDDSHVKYEEQLKALPALSDNDMSFLDLAHTATYKAYADAFSAATASKEKLARFKGLDVLQNSEPIGRLRLFTLMARIWSSNAQSSAKARALDLVTAELPSLHKSRSRDIQVLLPYIISALGDSSQSVRRSAAQLCKSMCDLYNVEASKDKADKDVTIWCADTVYGSRSTSLHLLASQDAFRFLSVAVRPALEACVLDAEHVTRALADGLEGKELKQPLRSQVCTCLAAHAAITPILSVKGRLLSILNRIGRTANDARKVVLLPFVKDWAALDSVELQNACSEEGVAVPDLDKKVLGSLTHRSTDEITMLKAIAGGDVESRQDISTLAFQRLREVWSAMKPPAQIALADFLLNTTLGTPEGRGSESGQAEALETLRALSYPSEVLVHLLESLPTASDLQDQPPSAKKRRTSKGETSEPRKVDVARVNAAVRRITVVLEILEASKPEQHPQLLKGCFQLLSELHHYKALLGSQLVYLQGLLMSCLLSIVSGLKSSSSANIDRSVIRADLIVECVRTTSSTQVHNTALLLIGSLASWAPELVLHNIMPLFTFMSTTLLRQSDEYSAHVTDQTVARIVPPLAESLKKRGKDLVSGASELLLSFTAAFEHIPLHRRASLFQHLVQTLGAEESLFAVVAMLAERYPTDSRVQPFVNDLMNHFTVGTQLKALKQYLNLVFDGLSPKRKLSDVILGFGEKDGEQIEDSIDTLLEALADLLQNANLRRQVAKEFAKGDAVAESLRVTYASLLDQTMQLGQKLASNETLKGTVDTVLSSLLRLTPTKDFIDTSAELMQSGSDATRQQVFHSLEARVAQAKRGDATLQQTFLEVLPNCCVFVDSKQPVGVRHAAITCIDQIVEKYGKLDRPAVFQTAEAVAGNAALGSNDASLVEISILCLASMIEVLGDEFIPIFPRILNQILNYLEKTLAADVIDKRLHNAAFRFTIAILDALPWMLSAQYLDRVLRLAARSVSNEDSLQDGINIVQQFCDLAPKKIAAPELFSSIDRTFDDVTSSGPEATGLQLGLLHAAVSHHTKATITKNAPGLFGILFKAFDLRRTMAEGERFEPGDFFVVNHIAMSMVLKLNDAIFRPFFLRLVEWATTGLPKKDAEGRILRSISLFSFTHLLFEQLKSIVTTYASYVIEPATSLLNTLTLSDDNERELLNVLLQTLTSSFTHDQDDFWQAPAHFDAMVTPLTKQLERANTMSVTENILPAIAELTAATASPEHYKTMNTAIMQYMRHQDAAVRLAAVECEKAVTERVNFEWLDLLPEMLPFISELQEDDDEMVERETLNWVRMIEGITGESLEGMLQ